MWVILFTAKLLINNFTNSYIGQAFTEGCKKKKKKNCLDKRALWAKGQVLKHPPLHVCVHDMLLGLVIIGQCLLVAGR